jgi:arginine utilization protein RocB
MPVLNIGPLGRDAHQWTERLDVQYSFGILPHFIYQAIKEAQK